MRPEATPHALLLGNGAGEVAAALRGAGFGVTALPWEQAESADPELAALIVCDLRTAPFGVPRERTRRWRAALPNRHVPILWLVPGPSPDLAAGLDAGADVCLPLPARAEVIAAQARALRRLHEAHQRLAERAAEAAGINQRLQQAYRQAEADRELARRVHLRFVPDSLPEVPGLRFGLFHRTPGLAGGDFFGVTRPDGEHAAIYLGDSLGRRTAAGALLNMLAVRLLTAGDDLAGPARALARLNRELGDLGVSDAPLMTLLALRINRRDGGVEFARAAAPPPLHLPHDGPARLWPGDGPFLGTPGGAFPARSERLFPGDKLLLCTDGARPPGEGGWGDSLAAAAERLRDLPVKALVDRLGIELGERAAADGFTLLGVEFTG